MLFSNPLSKNNSSSTPYFACLLTWAPPSLTTLFGFHQSGGGGGGGAGGEAALGAEAKSIEDQLKAKGGQFDIEAITMQYPVVYEESMNTVRTCLIVSNAISRRNRPPREKKRAREKSPAFMDLVGDAEAVMCRACLCFNVRRDSLIGSETRRVYVSSAAIQVLVQECIRYNKLIDIMEQSLPELQKALKGLVVMSGELEAVGKAIALNAVPESWEAKVKPSILDIFSHQFCCYIA